VSQPVVCHSNSRDEVKPAIARRSVNECDNKNILDELLQSCVAVAKGIVRTSPKFPSYPPAYQPPHLDYPAFIRPNASIHQSHPTVEVKHGIARPITNERTMGFTKFHRQIPAHFLNCPLPSLCILRSISSRGIQNNTGSPIGTDWTEGDT